MKKYFLFGILVLSGLIGRSQSMEDIKKLVKLQMWERVKPELDKYLADPKNAAKPEGWYYKGYTYGTLARDSIKSVAEKKTLNQESYVSLKKYMELDPKAPMTKEENNGTMYGVYYTFYDLGVKMYNEKNYQESYDLFKTTLEVHDYIYANKLDGPAGMKMSAHDTDIVWNLAVLANELKKKDEAMVYYTRIADADLGDDKYAEAYDELVKKYKREENKELFDKYIAAAKRHYPVDAAYWESTEIEYAIKGLENDALFKKYEELTISHPNSYMVFFNYGYELTKYVYSDEAKGKDVSGYKLKIPELFKKAISINSTIDANMLLANFYYNASFDYIDEANKIKGTKPEDIKKKNAQLALGKSTISLAIPYGEEAVKLFAALKEYKLTDKANYKQVLDVLIGAYKQNGNAAKAAEYEKLKGEVDNLKSK